MAHDVYSLGVCMMETLTWESLLRATEPPTMSKDFIAAFRSLGLLDGALESCTMPAVQIQQTLISMCDRLIPVEAGEKIALLVKDFLTCLDDGVNEDENDAQYQTPSNDKARRDVAVRFVDTALKTLRDIQSAI